MNPKARPGFLLSSCVDKKGGRGLPFGKMIQSFGVIRKPFERYSPLTGPGETTGTSYDLSSGQHTLDYLEHDFCGSIPRERLCVRQRAG
jgi:hypothetical protein